MEKIGRNSPCPCGSGKKYKRCCMSKLPSLYRMEVQLPPIFSDPNDAARFLKDLHHKTKIKQCLHPDQDGCSEKIIKAHSIQNNTILKRISNNGMVIMPIPRPEKPFDIITERGRREATVFTGFCARHDKELFAPIEDNPFDKSALHVFLHVYRCFAFNYHKKEEELNEFTELFRRIPRVKRGAANDFHMGCVYSLKDMSIIKEKCDNAIIRKDYDIFCSTIWEFDLPAMFACSGYEGPTYDLRGGYLQDLTDLDTPVKHYFFTVFPEGAKTYCIFAWLKENESFFSGFHHQLQSLTFFERKNLINNLAPLVCENFTFNPTFWDNWSDNQKCNFLKNVLNHDSEVFEDRTKEPKYDLFDLDNGLIDL